MKPAPKMNNVIRKTISFPRALAAQISIEAKSERRSFSPQVVKVIEDIFAAKTVRQSKAHNRKLREASR
jgi:hypothetical protein